jgi:hypothetical protein
MQEAAATQRGAEGGQLPVECFCDTAEAPPTTHLERVSLHASKQTLMCNLCGQLLMMLVPVQPSRVATNWICSWTAWGMQRSRACDNALKGRPVLHVCMNLAGRRMHCFSGMHART